MAFNWAPGWDSTDNNNGATKAQITTILATAVRLGSGDAGLLEALSAASDQVTIDKGIHPEPLHVTVGYLGGTWHVDLVATKDGPPAGYRVGKVTQWKS